MFIFNFNLFTNLFYFQYVCSFVDFSFLVMFLFESVSFYKLFIFIKFLFCQITFSLAQFSLHEGHKTRTHLGVLLGRWDSLLRSQKVDTFNQALRMTKPSQIINTFCTFQLFKLFALTTYTFSHTNFVFLHKFQTIIASSQETDVSDEYNSVIKFWNTLIAFFQRSQLFEINIPARTFCPSAGIKYQTFKENKERKRFAKNIHQSFSFSVFSSKMFSRYNFQVCFSYLTEGQ